jgi:hypothetical protein
MDLRAIEEVVAVYCSAARRLSENRFLAIQVFEYEPIAQQFSTFVVLSVTLLDKEEWV